MTVQSTPITLTHFQLKRLLEISEEHGDGPREVQPVFVFHLSTNVSEAYAGLGLYVTIEGEDLREALYLAVDSQDAERAISMREAKFQRKLQEYKAIEASIQITNTHKCKVRASCMFPHHSTWLYKVPGDAKSSKVVGRCLCGEFCGSVIHVELENPIE